MKKFIVAIACCALVAPLAFAKEPKQKKRTMAYVEPGVTVSAPGTVTQIEGGEAASFQPPNTLVIQHDGPGYYALDARGRVFNSKGELVDSAIRPGTRVHVYFSSNKGERTLDRVVID